MQRRDCTPLDEGLRKLENFIVTLEEQGNLGASVQEDIGIMFSQADEGGLRLNREEAREYQYCLDAILSSRLSSKGKGIYVDDRYNRKAVEKLMQTAILKALDIKHKRPEEPFKQRLKDAIKELRTALTAKPKRWMVHMRVEGLAPEGLPQRFGKVGFYIADESRIEQLKQPINAVVASGPSTPEKKQSLKSPFGQMIDDSFQDSPMASVEVRAGESQAALSLARRELRLTMDVINFYSDILFPPGLRIQLYPAGEVRPTGELSLVLGLDMSSYNLPYNTVGPLRKLSFRDIDPERARKVGVYRASDILKKDNRSKVEERVLASLQWAGRATVDQRPEEALLHYAIALECIILGRKQDIELAYRLRMRIAHLVSDTLNDRLEIKKKVRDLYDMRSKIVHSGHYEVADADVKLIRFLAKVCVLRILTEEPFISMTTEKELNNWFENAMLV